MAINIIDGFYLGSSTPIDSRFVVANAADRTAIVYKYDGLKVFQRDNRTTYIWNSTTSLWEVEGSGFLSGSGTLNYVPRWASGSTLGTSSLYSSGNGKVGINDANPLSNLQIKENTLSAPLSLNVRYISGANDSAVIGYNWYYTTSDQSFTSTKKSAYIEMTSQDGFLLKTRNGGSSTWITNLELNNSSSGWNIIRSSGSGTFISGTLSLSSSSSPGTVNQMVTFDGSFRTLKSIYKNVKYLTLTSNYAVLPEDHEIIITTSLTRTITLPTLTLSQLGRELSFTLQSSLSVNLIFSHSANIIDLGGGVFNGVLRSEGTIKFVAFDFGGGDYRWKVFQIGNNILSSGNDGEFMINSSGNWIRRNFLQHLASNSNLGTNVGTFLRLNGNSSNGNELSLSGNGSSKLQINHSTFALIQNGPISPSTTGRSLYIISTNNSTSIGDERIKIQTRVLNIPGAGGDPFSGQGSIQLASKKAIEIISQTGEYYMGPGSSGATSVVLPPTNNSLQNSLVIDTSNGQIQKSTYFWTNLQTLLTFKNGVESAFQTYTTTISNVLSGNPSITSQSCFYKIIGKVLFLQLSVVVSNTGANCLGFNISLPSGITSKTGRTQSFRKQYSLNSISASNMRVSVLSNATSIIIGNNSEGFSIPNGNTMDMRLDLTIEIN